MPFAQLTGVRIGRISGLFFASLCLGAPSKSYLSYLSDVQFPHPYCDTHADLNIANDYFFELANALPGVGTYNTLIEFYHKKDWQAFDERMETFRKVFENSPLMEPTAFLEQQVKYERFEAVNDEQKIKELEKQYRKLLLLYPKSELVPVLMATTAYFWLQLGRYDRSGSLYEQGKERFPFHPLFCVFQTGISENNFLLGGLKEADSGFKLVNQKCTNPKLLSIAKFRRVDIQFLRGESGAEKAYEEIASKQMPKFNLVHPPMLYHLGELKFRKKKYSSAKYYFEEYLRQEKENGACLPPALKRLADIALVDGEPLDKVAGKYFIVWDKDPSSDYGKFSYLHGLFLEIKTQSVAEQQRRLKLFDELADKISNERLRGVAYLEKGLVLLDLGERSALDYLARLDEKLSLDLKKGRTAQFVRKRFLALLEQIAEQVSKNSENESVPKYTTRKLLRDIEAAYPVWLEGSSSATQAKEFYAKIFLETLREDLGRKKVDAGKLAEELTQKYQQWVHGTTSTPDAKSVFTQIQLNRLEPLLAEGKIAEVAGVIQKWEEHPYFPLAHLATADKAKLAELLIRPLMDSKQREKVALEYAKHREQLAPALLGDAALTWLVVANLTQDEKRVEALLSYIGPLREPAALNEELDPSTRDFLWMELGKTLKKYKRYSDAEQAFDNVKTESFQSEILPERLALYKQADEFEKAYTIQKELVLHQDKEKQLPELEALRDLVQEGRLWKFGDDVVKLAQQLGVEGEGLASYYYLGGRAEYGLSNFESAAQFFEKALLLKENVPEAAEARYKLGKSLVSLKKPAQAKKIFDDLVKMNDSFWSPLAKNEIYLLETP